MQPSQARYDVVAEFNRRIRMRDGAELSADVYLPAIAGKAVEGRFSTVLLRTLNNRQDVGYNLDQHYFARRGYAVVIESCRGRFESDGTFYHGIAEMEDGYDTIEWIASQPWSNGRVGMTGISYSGAVQCAAAISNAPHFASIFHVKAPIDYYQDHYRRGGALNLYCVGNVLNFATSAKEAQDNPAMAESLARAYENTPQIVSRWPIKKGLSPLSQTPRLEAWLLDPMVHTDYDEFYKRIPLWQPIEYLEEYADLPSYYVGGWWDTFREDLFYKILKPRKSKPIKLLMGPWMHMNFSGVVGDVDFGPEAGMDPERYNELQMRWFDQTINDKDSGILNEPPVRIFIMGGGSGRRTPGGKLDHGGRWRYENEWPIARTRYTNYYLHPDGSLNTGVQGAEASATYTYDPADPVPTIGTTYFHMRKVPPSGSGAHRSERGVSMQGREHFVPYGPYDQREDPAYFGCKTNLPLSSRHDILVFQTPPLAAGMEVTGPITVNLWASSSAVDTDFTAKLVDVHTPNTDYPDGYAMGLTDSLIRATYRNGFGKRELMNPGEVYRFTMELPTTSNLFEKGHRIRIDISSSNFPDFDINPNTGDPYFKGRTVEADNTLYYSAARPSHVVLPIIPQ